MRRILFYCFIFISSFFIHVQAQKITVTARIDSTQMWIGNQTRLSFEISQKPGQKVITPVFSDTIISGLELVENCKSDTVTNPDGHLLVTQNYVVTSFEDSLLYIPSFPFVAENETVWSKSLSLKVVQPFQIDTASNSIADIKQVFNTKFNWKEFIIKILIGLLILALCVLLFILISRLIRKKPVFESQNKTPELPPHVIAIAGLDKIKSEKLWQQNRTKEYHTELTDVLRVYIEKIYDIPCMEMTSEEILSHLNFLRFEQKSAYTSLKNILHLADLVKFAKWNALIDEHELSLNNAYLFVNQTKKEEPETVEVTKQAVEDVNKTV
ncbi:MAG TPA: hypothetical protein P5084_07395 [Paludibacter sp.]|nr:hypothetical protein [Paludibacter sp.]